MTYFIKRMYGYYRFTRYVRHCLNNEISMLCIAGPSWRDIMSCGYPKQGASEAENASIVWQLYLASINYLKLLQFLPTMNLCPLWGCRNGWLADREQTQHFSGKDDTNNTLESLAWYIGMHFKRMHLHMLCETKLFQILFSNNSQQGVTA